MAHPERRRRIFYVTFRHVLVDDPATPSNPGSIAPELKQRGLTLQTLVEDLASDGVGV